MGMEGVAASVSGLLSCSRISFCTIEARFEVYSLASLAFSLFQVTRKYTAFPPLQCSKTSNKTNERQPKRLNQVKLPSK
jgi:hypothetical protein